MGFMRITNFASMCFPHRSRDFRMAIDGNSYFVRAIALYTEDNVLKGEHFFLAKSGASMSPSEQLHGNQRSTTRLHSELKYIYDVCYFSRLGSSYFWVFEVVIKEYDHTV